MILESYLSHYFNCHADAHHRANGILLDKLFTVFVESDQETLFQSPDNNTLELHIPRDIALRLQVMPTIFQWVNGIFLIPALYTATNNGLLQSLEQRCQLTELAQPAHRGLMWGLLHLFGLQGWVKLDNIENDVYASLTDLGRSILKIAQDHRFPLELLWQNLSYMREYTQHFHERDVTANNQLVINSYLQLADLMQNGWKLPVFTGDKFTDRALKQIRNFMDGAFLGPSMVALGMPIYSRQHERLIVNSESIFSNIRRHESGIEREELLGRYNRPLLDGCLSCLSAKNIVKSQISHVSLTETGNCFADFAPAYAALAVSYLKSYQHLHDLLFNDPDPLNIDQDTHLDRVMNIFGSSGAGSGPNSREICLKFLKVAFDETPLNDQPKGLADMGCGDGTTLSYLAEYIIHHTKRGKNLKQYPLYIIGADLYDGPLSRTRETLQKLDKVENVRVLTIKADISQPDAYNLKLIELGKAYGEAQLGLKDFLHTFMFLIHNRKLQLQSEDIAEAFLAERLEIINAKNLQAQVGEYFPGETFDNIFAIKSLFRSYYTGSKGVVSGMVVAADLIQFLLRWAPYAHSGLISLDAHTPWNEHTQEQVPENIDDWMVCEKLPHALNWGMHFVSRQYLMPFREYLLAIVLAGYDFGQQGIGGRIYPSGLPNIDLLPEYRFFSICRLKPRISFQDSCNFDKGELQT